MLRSHRPSATPSYPRRTPSRQSLFAIDPHLVADRILGAVELSSNPEWNPTGVNCEPHPGQYLPAHIGYLCRKDTHSSIQQGKREKTIKSLSCARGKNRLTPE